MSDTLISIIDVAVTHGLIKQSVFRVVKRLGIEPTMGLGANSRGQAIAYITEEEARIVLETLRSGQISRRSQAQDQCSVSDAILDERGVFYLLSLEPKSDPGRFKVGFTTGLAEILRQLRCSAPFVEIVAKWPCKRLWERTAIECVTEGCDRIHTEVFRTASLTLIRERCDAFFAIMPKLRHAA